METLDSGAQTPPQTKEVIVGPDGFIFDIDVAALKASSSLELTTPDPLTADMTEIPNPEDNIPGTMGVVTEQTPRNPARKAAIAAGIVAIGYGLQKGIDATALSAESDQFGQGSREVLSSAKEASVVAWLGLRKTIASIKSERALKKAGLIEESMQSRASGVDAVVNYYKKPTEDKQDYANRVRQNYETRPVNGGERRKAKRAERKFRKNMARGVRAFNLQQTYGEDFGTRDRLDDLKDSRLTRGERRGAVYDSFRFNRNMDKVDRRVEKLQRAASMEDGSAKRRGKKVDKKLDRHERLQNLSSQLAIRQEQERLDRQARRQARAARRNRP